MQFSARRVKLFSVQVAKRLDCYFSNGEHFADFIVSTVFAATANCKEYLYVVSHSFDIPIIDQIKQLLFCRGQRMQIQLYFVYGRVRLGHFQQFFPARHVSCLQNSLLWSWLNQKIFNARYQHGSSMHLTHQHENVTSRDKPKCEPDHCKLRDSHMSWSMLQVGYALSEHSQFEIEVYPKPYVMLTRSTKKLHLKIG